MAMIKLDLIIMCLKGLGSNFLLIGDR